MFYEKKIAAFSALERELSRLDSDAGIRIKVTFRDRPCFAFITKFVGRYTAMIYERSGTAKAPTVGERVLATEFASLNELGRFLKGIIPKSVEAYLY